MKILEMKTNQNIRIGRQITTHFQVGDLDAGIKPSHPGLSLESLDHPTLGGLVVIRCNDLTEKDRVKFIFPSNIEELTIGDEKKAPKAVKA